jgi:hypothetical protein
MRKLTITSGDRTVVYELVDDVVSVGRGPENTIVLDDLSASTRHARLQRSGDDFELIDVGSTNGTRLNGTVIAAPVLLRAGDRIRFGKVEACFECRTPTETQPLPRLPESAAAPAEISARPSDFANASPFPRRTGENDPVRTALFAIVAVAVLAFLASMLALLQMQPPSP